MDPFMVMDPHFRVTRLKGGSKMEQSSTPPTAKGRPLPPGGTVGVVAPASPFHNRSTVLRGVEWWEEKG
jgi:hypothetical protein